MTVHITYIKFLENGQKQEVNRVIKLSMAYSDKEIKDHLISELKQCGLKTCVFELWEFANNAFDVYKPFSNDKLFEVFWMTQYSFFDRLKLKLFPMHYAKKGA